MDGEGSIISLYAEGPQNKYFVDKQKSPVEQFKQSSRFSIDQASYPLRKPSSRYLGSESVFIISPKEIPGDLLCNAYLKCTLPNIFSNSYSEQIGRALLKSATFAADEVTIEKLDSTWYIVRDELFLDENEKTILSNVINNSNRTYTGGTIDLIIPLEFFFCRRHAPKNSSPYFPLAAITRQKLFFTFEFSDIYEISSVTDQSFDLVGIPELILEYITLASDERQFFRQPQEILINKVFREVPQKFDNRTTTINVNLTAGFPVTLLTWFIRKRIQNTADLYYTKIFDFSYLQTDNITLLEQDIFDYLKIFINNEEITDNQPGLKFYKYLQPLMHGLSSPVKDIYMYSFSTSPREFNNGGYLDFSKVDSNTSFLTFKINSKFALDISENYDLYIYYYGYNILTFNDGYCSVKYL